MSRCVFPGCSHGADPRWGGYCDGHGATTERELEARNAAIVAIATEAVELRTQVAALREQRRVLREALARTYTLAANWADSVGRSHPDHEVVAEARAALDATKEEP